MAPHIVPRVIRGRLFFRFGPVLFVTFAAAASAWSAAECHFDIAETGGAT
jgi:hypothetical protein